MNIVGLSWVVTLTIGLPDKEVIRDLRYSTFSTSCFSWADQTELTYSLGSSCTKFCWKGNQQTTLTAVKQDAFQESPLSALFYRSKKITLFKEALG